MPLNLVCNRSTPADLEAGPVSYLGELVHRSRVGRKPIPVLIGVRETGRQPERRLGVCRRTSVLSMTLPLGENVGQHRIDFIRAERAWRVWKAVVRDPRNSFIPDSTIALFGAVAPAPIGWGAALSH